MQQRQETGRESSEDGAEGGASPLGKIDITKDVQAALCKRGMAWMDDDGQFRLNRKGRRWLQKQVGRDAVRVLNTDALKRATQQREGERKQAWAEMKKQFEE